MSASSSATAAVADPPTTPTNDQTWRPSSGIVFGARSSPISREHTWSSTTTIPFARSTISQNGLPLASQHTRQVHSNSGRGIPKAVSPDETVRKRSLRVRKAKCPSPRPLSTCVSGEASSSAPDDCEPAMHHVFESQSRTPSASAATFKTAHAPQVNRMVSSEHPLNVASASSVVEDAVEDVTAVEHVEVVEEQKQTPSEVYAVPALSNTYQIPDHVMEAAREAGQPWQYELYRDPKGHKPMLHYCRKRDASESVARQLLDDGATLLGFDLEWKSHRMRGQTTSKSIKDNVSVIQIASESRVVLFHLALHHGRTADEILAPSLRRILESASIVKVGVNINGDCTRLATFLGVNVRGRFELSHAHKLVQYSQHAPRKVNRKLVALDKLVEEHLGLPLYKGDVRTSSWERELGMEQLKYAASDAYAGLQLFGVLDAKRRALRPTPPMPLPAETRLPIRLAVASQVEDDDAVEAEEQTAEADEDVENAEEDYNGAAEKGEPLGKE